MAPFYRPYDPDLKVEEDDIRGIQKLYGRIDICTLKRIDTIFTLPDNSTYVLTGNQNWKLKNPSIEKNDLRDISENWPNLPANLDASFVWKKNGKIFFFKGSKFWRFSNVGEPDPGYPKNIGYNFVGIPDNLDATLELDEKSTSLTDSTFGYLITPRRITLCLDP